MKHTIKQAKARYNKRYGHYPLIAEGYCKIEIQKKGAVLKVIKPIKAYKKTISVELSRYIITELTIPVGAVVAITHEFSYYHNRGHTCKLRSNKAFVEKQVEPIHKTEVRQTLPMMYTTKVNVYNTGEMFIPHDFSYSSDACKAGVHWFLTEAEASNY